MYSLFHLYHIALNECYTDILEDNKQLLYTECSHTNCGGITCTNPVPKYLTPLLCGDHWYQAKLSVPKCDQDTDPETDNEEPSK